MKEDLLQNVSAPPETVSVNTGNLQSLLNVQDAAAKDAAAKDDAEKTMLQKTPLEKTTPQ
ncbi:hypothetical protein N0V93_010349 [Gnomoniopsis smithogilvyi]|uniref:Uncharacterized protein n=1 Tax=Gnomoniopsis smithogilvyi TaxID=1191159 RepID=A0A9W8YIL0_9PEZI|nr:hypothetical protein N0V93_010349 [Gnomoniopsis smithogilvyi]